MSESAPASTSRPVLTAVILHEDAAANEQASTILQVLETAFHDVADICVKRWSFHQLERLDIRAMACHQGKEATILVVCSSTGMSIPESVSTWMERTYPSAHGSKPLIVRLQEGPIPKEDFTYQLASSWNVPLVSDFSLGALSGWEVLRDFVELRLSTDTPETQDDYLDAEKSTRLHPPVCAAENHFSPIDQAIRDRAYQLWVAAGRPDGRTADFWHIAEQEVRSARNDPESSKAEFNISPNTKTHENIAHIAGLRSQPSSEFMLRIPTDLHAGTRNALLQHLARVPQELLTRSLTSRRAQTSSPVDQSTVGFFQQGQRTSAPADPFKHPSISPMIIRLDWFGTEPTSTRELRIHKTLENLQDIKPISRASMRVEEQTKESPAFHLTLMLTMPGPDVLAHGSGHTFDEALMKLETAALKSLANRIQKTKQHTRATRGVKALHRG